VRPETLSLLWILALSNAAFGRSPAEETRSDSLRTAGGDSAASIMQTGRGFNPAVALIRGWQAVSFRTRLIECQFDPCCSEYGVRAFEQYGFFKAVLFTADRIARCHPAARRYYPAENGRLSDPFLTASIPGRGAVPWLTIPVSLAIPGFHKMAGGRFYDGLFMLLITGTTGAGTALCAKRKNAFCIPLGGLFLAFYASDAYFNLLSLKIGGRDADRARPGT
jgi:putative component of membrane protein insertase Oxa1/YidC/SpoIIIJ protein YidD